MVRLALALGLILFSAGARAVGARSAQYIIHYETQAEADHVKALLASSAYELVRESSDLKAILVRGPVGIDRVRALAVNLIVERSSKVSTARRKTCSRAMTRGRL